MSCLDTARSNSSDCRQQRRAAQRLLQRAARSGNNVQYRHSLHQLCACAVKFAARSETVSAVHLRMAKGQARRRSRGKCRTAYLTHPLRTQPGMHGRSTRRRKLTVTTECAIVRHLCCHPQPSRPPHTNLATQSRCNQHFTPPTSQLFSSAHARKRFLQKLLPPVSGASLLQGWQAVLTSQHSEQVVAEGV